MDARPLVQKAQCQLFTDTEDRSMPMRHSPLTLLSKFLGAFRARVRRAAKKCPTTNLNEEQDVRRSTQLCDLPDDILWHILSFLLLKDVVRTSRLSKRWDYLSRNNPKLDISIPSLPGQKHVVNFASKSLLLHNFPLKVFRLYCDTNVENRSRIHTWITAAIKRKVEKLHVHLYGVLLESLLPNCVFNCETLIEFHLFMPHELRLPSLVCLKSLKVLTLEWVDIGSANSVEKPLSFPSLEVLSLINCKWRRLKVLHICAAKLLRLHILEHYLKKEDLESPFCLSIQGARIESFTYNGRFIHRYEISSWSFLEEACIVIRFDWHHYHPHNAYHGYKLLKDLSSVKRLKLNDTNKFLHERSDFLNSLPVFSNLSELKFKSNYPLLLENRFLVLMLHKCPHLSHLEFTEGIYAESETVDMIFNPVPQCFLSSLKVIKVRNFRAGDIKRLGKALLAMRILLRTARVLEKLFILPRQMKLAGNLLQLLNSLPRVSDKCEVLLGSIQKLEDRYRIIEHFAFGRRRLELFGENRNIRTGWLTVGKGLSSLSFNAEVHGLVSEFVLRMLPPSLKKLATLSAAS